MPAYDPTLIPADLNADVSQCIAGRLSPLEERELYDAVIEVRSMARELRSMASEDKLKEVFKTLPAPLRMMLGIS